MEHPADLPEQLLDQRVRNRIIEVLELAASPDAQASFGPTSVINFWGDWVHEPIDANYRFPIFTDDEREAIKRVSAAVDEICKATASPKSVDNELQSPLWAELTVLANQALTVFSRRGRFSEDRIAT